MEGGSLCRWTQENVSLMVMTKCLNKEAGPGDVLEAFLGGNFASLVTAFPHFF